MEIKYNQSKVLIGRVGLYNYHIIGHYTTRPTLVDSESNWTQFIFVIWNLYEF